MVVTLDPTVAGIATAHGAVGLVDILPQRGSMVSLVRIADVREYMLIRKALEDPCRWIASNAGWEGSVVVDKIKNNKGSFGFNAATEEFEDLMKAGIIDPTKVVRSALQNAASVASLLLTTECMVADKPDEGKGAGGGMPPGGMM